MELKLLLVLLVCACAVQSKRMTIPEDMRRPATVSTARQDPPPPAPSQKSPFADNFFGPEGPQPVAASAASAKAAAAKPAPVDPSHRTVLRMTEHGRVWEMELPDTEGTYEVRVPIGAPVEQPTLADQELLGKAPKDAPPKSYLTALAKISDMYSAHRFEMALIEIVDLEQQYPKDSRILAMKGSLYQKLGKPQLAREAWKKALEMDPSDTAVAEALRGLKEE